VDACRLRVALAILFGVFAFLWPEPGLVVVVASFAPSPSSMAPSHRGGHRGSAVRPRAGPWWSKGCSASRRRAHTPQPGLTELALLYFIPTGHRNRRFRGDRGPPAAEGIEGEWALALIGVLSVLFCGVAVILGPEAGALSLAG